MREAIHGARCIEDEEKLSGGGIALVLRSRGLHKGQEEILRRIASYHAIPRLGDTVHRDENGKHTKVPSKTQERVVGATNKAEGATKTIVHGGVVEQAAESRGIFGESVLQEDGLVANAS